MFARYDRQVGTLETIAAQLTREGFLKAHGIVARTGVLYYQDEFGNTSAELIPPEELFEDESLASLGGKPLTNDHPVEDGCHCLVTPDNATAHTRGAVGNEIKVDRRVGFVRIMIDAHDGTTINDIRAGKQQLSSGRTIEQIDETPGIWDPRTQTYHLGEDARGRSGIAFDRIQRKIRHNHVAVVDRGRAGPRCSIRIDSGAGVRVASSGATNMAFVNSEEGSWVVRMGDPPWDILESFDTEDEARAEMDRLHADNDPRPAARGVAAFERWQNSMMVEDERTDSAGGRVVAQYEARIDKLEGKIVALRAKFDAASLRAEGLQTRLDAINPGALVKARLDLERSVGKLRIDGIDAMTDRQIRVAAIQQIKPDYVAEGVSDDHVGIYFDAMLSLIGEAVPRGDGGAAAVRGARHDAAPLVDMAEKRRIYNAKFHYTNTKRGN